MSKKQFTQEILVQDIWDAQADLQIKVTPLETLARYSLEELKSMRDELWTAAYPNVGLDWISRMNFNQECKFNYDDEQENYT